MRNKTILIATLFVFSSLAANALTIDESSSEAALKKQGYSYESVRMVKLSKSKTNEDVTYPQQNKHPIIQILKKIIYVKDLTDDNEDFGARPIKF